MHPVDQAQLSPVRTRPEQVPLPYGLIAGDVHRVVGPGAPAGTLTCRRSHRKQGLHGGANSCIVTLVLRAGDGTTLRRTVFIKAVANAAEREAEAYGLLARAGVRTPELLAVVDRAGSEVLVLEFLPKIGIDFQDVRQVEDLLRQVARLNSVATEPCATSAGLVSGEFDQTVRDALTALAAEGAITGGVATHWFRAYEHAQRAVCLMPTALTHGELYFQQVGVTEDSPSVVLFDLATLAVRARLTDVANIVKPLAERTARRSTRCFSATLLSLRQAEARPPASTGWSYRRFEW